MSKVLACLPCKERKIKCVTEGESFICTRCLQRNIACTRPPYQRLQKAKEKKKRSSSPANPSHDIGFEFAGEARQHGDQRLHPLINPARLFRNSISQITQSNSTLYDSKPDTDVGFHPVKMALLPVEEARSLFDMFVEHYGTILGYFDPHLHTYDYVSSHSAMLLTCILWKAASGQSTPPLPSLIDSLYHHIETILIPAILLKGYRSIEIVQGLMMLAAFQSSGGELSEERSWNFLGHAIRLATDLDIHSRVTSTQLLPVVDEVKYRQRRNAERTWMNLWLHEASLSQHTGRRSLLTHDSIIIESKQWHVQPLATQVDVALVAMIELRSTNHQVRTMYTALQDDFHSSQVTLRCYLDRCEHDLKDWSRRWLQTSQSHHGASTTTLSPTMRLELGPLYFHHSLVQLTILLFQRPNLLSQSICSRTLTLIYSNCIEYLDKFVLLLPPNRLAKCYNSMFVSATYIVVVSLRLARLCKSYPIIDQDLIFKLTTNVIKCIKEASSTGAQPNTGQSCADFLQKLLSLHQGMSSIESPAKMSLDNHDDAAITSNLGFQDVEDYTFYLDDAELLTWAQSMLAPTGSSEQESFQQL